MSLSGAQLVPDPRKGLMQLTKVRCGICIAFKLGQIVFIIWGSGFRSCSYGV